MELVTSERTIAINQMGLDFVLIDPLKAPLVPGTMDLHMSVDGRNRQWSVLLPFGAEIGAERVSITRVAKQ